jgi:hypothetical protein
VLCLSALAYGGMDGIFFKEFMYVGFALLLFLLYKYVKLRRTIYTITGEQFRKLKESSPETMTISSCTESLTLPCTRTSCSSSSD